MVLPFAAQKAIKLAVAVVENPSLAEKIPPQEIAVTLERQEIGIGERLPVPAAAQRNEVLLVDRPLFGRYGQEQILKFTG